MKRSFINDNLVNTLIENIQASPRRNDINKYIEEVAEKCVLLCQKGEHLRVFNEYKLLIKALKQEFDV